jgi:P-loop Domain of unknown function (DUF2791)
MRHCAARIGDAYFRTPRNTIKGFLDLLAVLEQNPGSDWRQLVGAVDLATETDPELAPLAQEGEPGPGHEHAEEHLEEPAEEADDADDLSSFRL